MASSATPPRLPSQASLDPELARRILEGRTPQSAQAALEFWQQRFAALGEEDVFETLEEPETKALRFIKHVPNITFKELLRQTAARVPRRTDWSERRNITLGHVPPEQGGDAHLLADEAGCLMSLEEIAAHLGSTGGLKTLAADVASFKQVASAGDKAPVPDSAVRGLRAMRELFDALLRFRMATAQAEFFRLTLPESLALHRQEGGLAIAPAPESFTSAPLIATRTSGCRIHKVLHSVNTDKEQLVEQPGYCLVFPFEKFQARLQPQDKLVFDEKGGLVSTVERLRTPTSLRFEMLIVDLLVASGLDKIIGSAPAMRNFDELQQLIIQRLEKVPDFNLLLARSLQPGVSSADALELSPAQREHAILFVYANLLFALIESPAEPAEDIATRMETAAQVLQHLIEVHRIEQVTRGGDTDVHLLGHQSRVESPTFNCLVIQNQWYASRKKPHTLLAHQDRKPDLLTLPDFSPFVAYLRFQSGDTLFVGILLRVLDKLPDLRKAALAARKKRNAGWGDKLLVALAAVKWKKYTGAHAATIRKHLEHWRSSVKDEDVGFKLEHTWHTLGLITAVTASAERPTWLASPPTPDDAELVKQLALHKRSAAALKEILTLIRDLELSEAIDLALEFTPVDILVKEGAVPLPRQRAQDIPKTFRPRLGPKERLQAFIRFRARAPVVKAHNFERFRLVYEKAGAV